MFISLCFSLRMVVPRLGLGGTSSDTGLGLGFGFGSEPIDERLLELIKAKVTCNILDATPHDFRYRQGGDLGAHRGAAHVFSI